MRNRWKQAGGYRMLGKGYHQKRHDQRVITTRVRMGDIDGEIIIITTLSHNGRGKEWPREAPHSTAHTKVGTPPNPPPRFPAACMILAACHFFLHGDQLWGGPAPAVSTSIWRCDGGEGKVPKKQGEVALWPLIQ